MKHTMRAAQGAAAALLLCSLVHTALSFPAASLMETEIEGEETRKVLGSSVVTSVSVIMDLGNGSHAFADSTGRPVPKPVSAAHLSSPPSLMSPDRYEFYTFNDAGDLVKRLMTMDEIQGLIAGESVEIGSDLPGIDPEDAVDQVEERPPAFFFLPHPMERNPDWSPPGVDKVVKRVQDVLADVQNKITIEESQPSWAIKQPDANHPPSFPTQHIPGSTLQLLDPIHGFGGFGRPQGGLVSEASPNSDEAVTEHVMAQDIVPSSTPTLAPVSQTIRPSTTAPLLKITEIANQLMQSTSRVPSRPSTAAPTTTTTHAPTTTTTTTTKTTTTTTSTTTAPSTTTTLKSTSAPPVVKTTFAPKTTAAKPLKTTEAPTPSTSFQMIQVAEKIASTTPSTKNVTQVKDEGAFEKLPEISVKPPNGQMEIKIPSTIIADLLIEDQQEVIRHDTLPSSTQPPSTVVVVTTKQSPTAKPQATTFNEIPTTQKVQGYYLTSTLSPRPSTSKINQPGAAPPVTSTTTKAPLTTAEPATIVTRESLTTEQSKLVSTLINAVYAPIASTLKSAIQPNVFSTTPSVMVEKKTTVLPQTQTPASVTTDSGLVKITTAAPLKKEPSTTMKPIVVQNAIRSPVKPVASSEAPTAASSKPMAVSTQTVRVTQAKPTPPTTAMPSISIPNIDEIRLQMDQITQALTDKKSSSVQPMLISTASPNRPAVSFSTGTTVSFGSSVKSNAKPTGKTTPQPIKTTAVPTTSTSKPSTTEEIQMESETTTDNYISEMQMTTLNLPPSADNLVMDEVTSKTNEVELQAVDQKPIEFAQDGVSDENEQNYWEESTTDNDDERFEGTEKIETDDVVVPFISQLFDGSSEENESLESASDEKSTESSSSEEEDATEAVMPPSASTSIKTTPKPIATTPTKFIKVTTINPKPTTLAPTTAKIVAKTTSSPPKTTEHIKISSSTGKPLGEQMVQAAAIKTPAIPSKNVSEPNKITSGAQIVSEGVKIKTKPPQTSNTAGAPQMKPTNSTKLGEQENMTLVSTTEYSVNPTTIKHASTIKIDTKGQGSTQAANSKPVNVVDKNNFKEVLDSLLAPAGILNFGDSSEETIKEDIYTTFIPASTTVKNTASEDKINTTQIKQKPQQSTTPESTQAKEPQIKPNNTKVTPKPQSTLKPSPPTTVRVSTEKIPDLEVSWQEPQEVIWTAQKSSVSPSKKTTPPQVKTTTAAPTKATMNPPTKVSTENVEKTTESVFTKSNDDGMELIAVSDRTKTSTPSFALKQGSKPMNTHVQSLISLRPAPVNNLGLEASTVTLDEDVRRFIDLNNDIAIRLYKHTTSDLDKMRSIAVSPFGATSLLAMVFIGSRGQTSAQINDFLPFDDMITFNPHLVMRNITDSVIMSPDLLSAAIVRQLYSQKGTKEPLDFYKARAGAFYDGLVQQIDFEDVSKIVRERTNELVKTQTSNKVPEFLGDSAVLRFSPPLAALSANVFQMNCALSSSLGSRDGEFLFHGEKPDETHVIPATVWSGEFMVGYDAGLDATAVEIPHSNSPGGALTSSVFVMPGRPGTGNGGVPLLARLEARLISRRAWSGLLRNLQRSEEVVDIQVPRFEHRSVLNLTVPLERMGLKDLFSSGVADLRGVNGMQDMYLSDLTQMNVFSFCSTPDAEGHVETYPSTKRTGRVGSRGGEDYEDEYDWRTSGVLSLPLPLRPRQARIPMSENARIKFDRPFMYFVRHNPTGMILHIGRFNPRFGS